MLWVADRRMTRLHEDFVLACDPRPKNCSAWFALVSGSHPLFDFPSSLCGFSFSPKFSSSFLVQTTATMTRRRTMEMQRQAKMTADASTTICDDGHRCENWSLCVEKEGDEGVSPHSCFGLLLAQRAHHRSPQYCMLMRPLPLDSTFVELLL